MAHSSIAAKRIHDAALDALGRTLGVALFAFALVLAVELLRLGLLLLFAVADALSKSALKLFRLGVVAASLEPVLNDLLAVVRLGTIGLFELVVGAFRHVLIAVLSLVRVVGEVLRAPRNDLASSGLSLFDHVVKDAPDGGVLVLIFSDGLVFCGLVDHVSLLILRVRVFDPLRCFADGSREGHFLLFDGRIAISGGVVFSLSSIGPTSLS